MKGTYKEAAETFIKVADWLGDEHEPAVTGLIKIAEELDSDFKASTFAQYTLTHRYLMKARVVEEEDKQDDEDLDFS